MRTVALVTGASRGIGKQIALTLAKEGYDLACHYRTENPALSEIQKQIEENGVSCFWVQGDISRWEDCEDIAEKVKEKYGQIDVLVNNAGITKDGLFLRMKKEDFESVLQVNLMGTVQMTKQIVPSMVKQRSGRIINISSVVGTCGNAGQTNYSAAKAGILGFTKSLAKELAGRHILVNAIAPGFIDTQMTECLKEEIKQEIQKQIPLKRMGTPQDVANVVKFLASEDSSYMTGQVLHVDGGMFM